jgi:hypothetical protein
MPWCDACDRFLSPSTVLVDGSCPTCGRAVDRGNAVVPRPVTDSAGDDEPLGPIPWHLKFLAGALAIYLGYRAFEGIEWVVQQF